MRVIRIGEQYSIATGEVETYDLLPNMKSMMFLLVCALAGIVVSRKRKEEN